MNPTPHYGPVMRVLHRKTAPPTNARLHPRPLGYHPTSTPVSPPPPISPPLLSLSRLTHTPYAGNITTLRHVCYKRVNTCWYPWNQVVHYQVNNGALSFFIRIQICAPVQFPVRVRQAVPGPRVRSPAHVETARRPKPSPSCSSSAPRRDATRRLRIEQDARQQVVEASPASRGKKTRLNGSLSRAN